MGRSFIATETHVTPHLTYIITKINPRLKRFWGVAVLGKLSIIRDQPKDKRVSRDGIRRWKGRILLSPSTLSWPLSIRLSTNPIQFSNPPSVDELLFAGYLQLIYVAISSAEFLTLLPFIRRDLAYVRSFKQGKVERDIYFFVLKKIFLSN